MDQTYVFFLGSHSTLSAAECFTVLTREGFLPRVKAAHPRFLILSLDKPLPENFINRLGGVSRIGELRAEQDHMWSAAELVALLSPAPQGEARPTGRPAPAQQSPASRRGDVGPPKFQFGLSTIGANEVPLKKLGLDIKKLLKEQNVKASFVTPAKGQQLNSAQVLFNRLQEAPNAELTFLRSGTTYYLTQTRQVQDIQAYERRDTGRPARDAYVGMLPPKVAQMMLNLLPSFPANPPVILDPFCGTGVVLQEGWLFGYAMLGSDAKAIMVNATEQNVRWLQQLAADKKMSLSTSPPVVFQHDIRLPYKRIAPASVDAIVTEPYLGEPLSAPLPADKAVKREHDLADLYLAFFRNAQTVLKNGAFVTFILPAFAKASFSAKATADKPASRFRLFPASFLDAVTKLGYDLSHVVPNELQQAYEASERGTLVYARPEALVGRELTLWRIRKPEDQHN